MRKVLLSAIAFMAMALAGCATIPTSNGLVYDVDHQKVALVENYARQNNIQVIWVNMPQRASAASR